MVDRRIMGALALALLVPLAGCAEVKGEAASAASTSEAVAAPTAPAADAAPGHIAGKVVDTELVPIEGVTVLATPGDHLATTDASGVFDIGPLEPGEYVVVAEKIGYASAEQTVKVSDDRMPKITLTVEPKAADVPYHESFNENMYLVCHVVGGTSVTGPFINFPCGGVDLVLGTTNAIDKWIFFFSINKPGFKSLVMEMMWQTQTLGNDGLMQLSYIGKVEPTPGSAGLTVDDTVYGQTMGPPFRDVIHAGGSYWVEAGKNVTFYPKENETAAFKMLIAGGGDNTTVPETAVFIEFRPSAWLTMFYNRQATREFTVLPDE